MKSYRALVVAVLVAVVASASVAGPAEASNQTEVKALVDWNFMATDWLTIQPRFPLAAGAAPPASQVDMAMVQGAVYDAVMSIQPSYQRYLTGATFDSNASKEAAVATAASRILTYIFSTVPTSIPFPKQSELLQEVAVAYADSLTAIPDGPMKDEGIAAGNAAADAMITARTGDGRFGPSPWDQRTGIGYWQPLLPNGTAPLDPTPWVGGARPFLLENSSQFRTDGPNALTSQLYAEDFNEVKTLGSVNSSARTSEQTHIAVFWQSTPVRTWNAVARTLIVSRGLTIEDGARELAMMAMTAADSQINAWNDKYYWDFWRPWTAIRQADQDGNPATEADVNWAPLLTAPYPEHPSGHLSNDGAAIPVLQMFFGDKTSFEVTSLQPEAPREYDRFSIALREIIDARVWAGLHFRTADIQSVVLGQRVFHYMLKRYFQPVQ